MTEQEKAEKYYRDFKRWEDRMRVTMMLVMAVIAGAFFAWLSWFHGRQPIRERAAYLQGYYGIDADTAWEMALQGHGKTAEEVVQGK